mmetsp:Transcript_18599/g.31285  ORF Transcript_18599/g.31285 Transcript_18599/m.31285 type:complete len:211 (-) Transcript_18599:1626-2258(-)
MIYPRVVSGLPGNTCMNANRLNSYSSRLLTSACSTGSSRSFKKSPYSFFSASSASGGTSALLGCFWFGTNKEGDSSTSSIDASSAPKEEPILVLLLNPSFLFDTNRNVDGFAANNEFTLCWVCCFTIVATTCLRDRLCRREVSAWVTTFSRSVELVVSKSDEESALVKALSPGRVVRASSATIRRSIPASSCSGEGIVCAQMAPTVFRFR